MQTSIYIQRANITYINSITCGLCFKCVDRLCLSCSVCAWSLSNIHIAIRNRGFTQITSIIRSARIYLSLRPPIVLLDLHTFLTHKKLCHHNNTTTSTKSTRSNRNDDDDDAIRIVKFTHSKHSKFNYILRSFRLCFYQVLGKSIHIGGHVFYFVRLFMWCHQCFKQNVNWFKLFLGIFCYLINLLHKQWTFNFFFKYISLTLFFLYKLFVVF